MSGTEPDPDVSPPEERSPRWGRETRRALDLGPVWGRGVPLELVHGIAAIKAAAAVVNGRHPAVPEVDPELAAAIDRAATDVALGRFDDQFPLDALQTGSGTATNMNVNEVIADRASELAGRTVHPNDHVNACQSSNDVVPSALRLFVAMCLRDRTLPALDQLAGSLRALAARHAATVTLGRTHLMDATPVLLGDVVGGWAAQLDEARAPLERAMIAATAVPLGGSAVGSGLNVPDGWAEAVARELATRTGAPVRLVPDRFAAMSGGELYSTVSGGLRTAAGTLTKLAEDLRGLAAGPIGGPGEVVLPTVAAGSSIMPGKVNPVVPEVVIQAAARVLGNDVTVGVAASGGRFQLNTFQPLVAVVLEESLRLVERSASLLARRCVDGLEVREAVCRQHAEASSAVVTGLAVHLGYDRAAALVAASGRDGGPTLRSQAVDAGLAPALVDRLLDADRLARGGRG